MANEQTASLPPIIEDESDENLLPMLYQKELERKDYRSIEKNSPSDKRDFSEQTNETQLPYNSWKAKNRMPHRTGENGIFPDMVSRLGQSLEKCHSVVPGRLQEGYQAANHPHTMYNQDNSAYQTHNVSNQTKQDFVNPSTEMTHNPNIEVPRYLHTHQDFLKHPQMFDSNFIQNSNSGIYGNGYPGFLLHSNKNMYSPNGNSPFHGQSTVNSSYKHCDVSPTTFKPHSSLKSPCNPHSFDPEFNYENHRIEKVPCQKICCKSSFRSQNTYMDGMLPSNGPHFNYHNASYDNSVSSQHNSKQQKINCNCNHGLETKYQKKDKRTDKNLNKQINDLYRIVWLQNQQLIQLQNELKKLIEYNVKNEDRIQKISEQEHVTKKQSKSTMEKRMFNLHVIEENKNLMEKVSVGIMTSFIDTTSVKKKKRDIKKKKEIESSHDSSSECETSSSTELSSEQKDMRGVTNRNVQRRIGNKKNKSGRNVEDSILLNGVDIPAFIENIPSPTGSINIDMQDYASSSESDSSDVSDSGEDKPAPVGWTFYDKVVGKVNNMLNESESESEEESENEIRNKTLEQLRKLGVSIEESPTSKRVTFNEAAYISQQQKLFLGESDTSMKMNALAMKYLQEDKMTKDSTTPKSLDKCSGGLTNNTNLSVATLRYLEKYHLLPMVTSSPEIKSEKSKKKKEKNKEEKKAIKKKSKTSDLSGKILDITAIKQQPKLLPKPQ